jgi:hypothetical protein
VSRRVGGECRPLDKDPSCRGYLRMPLASGSYPSLYHI